MLFSPYLLELRSHLVISLVSDYNIKPGKEYVPFVLIVGVRTYMIIPQCLNILVDIIECLNDPYAVVIVLIWSCVEGSLDIDLLVALGLKARAYLEFLNILVL